MKIKEFIEKVNENERMEAEEVDGSLYHPIVSLMS